LPSTPGTLRKLGANLPSASRLALTTMAKHSKNANHKKVIEKTNLQNIA